MQQHKMAFSVELGVNAKNFCNHFYEYYVYGMGVQSLKLIRQKHMNATFQAQFQSPFGTQDGETHITQVSVSTVNNFKKGLGNQIFTLHQKYKYSDTFKIGVKTQFQEKSRRVFFNFNKAFYEKRLMTNFVFGFAFDKGAFGLVPPSISVSSSHQSHNVNMGLGLGQGLSFGISKEPGHAGIPFGYNLGLTLAGDSSITVSPDITYDLNNGVLLQAGCSLSTNGTHSHNMTLSYMFTDQKQLGIEFSRSYDENSGLKESKCMLKYYQGSFLFQVPIMCYNSQESTSGMLMTYALYSLLNGAAFWGLTAWKKSQSENKNRHHEMQFNFYQ